MIVIERSAAPFDYSFDISEYTGLGLVPRLSHDSSGAIEFITPGGRVGARVDRPWARTAKGRPVPTSFALLGDRLVQRVEHSGLSPADYPVVADPAVIKHCGWITCTWYYSVYATHRMADRFLTNEGALISGIGSSVVCAYLAPGIVAAIGCGVLFAAGGYYFARQLHQADRAHRCFTVSTPPRGLYGSVHLRNGYCHRS